MNKEKVIQESQEALKSLMATIKLFDDQTYNEIPFEGSWTPGQVVEHTVLSAEGFTQLIQAETRPTERAADELEPQLKSILLNFELKMHSPDFIYPEMKDYDSESQLERIKKVSDELKHALAALNLSPTCVGFELPGLGFVTRYEAAYFVVYHTQRHTHQLQEIGKYLELSN